MFLLCILSDETELDAMPVIKTVCYPWADDSYRPLAYGRIAYIPKRGFLVDLQSFEREPVVAPPQENLFSGSCVSMAIARDAHSPLFVIGLDSSGQHASFLNGTPLSLSLDVNTYAGIDEQGWYWGVRFVLPPETIGFSVPFAGQTLLANIYVTHAPAETDPAVGAAAAMTARSIFSVQNLHPVSVIAY